MGRQLSGGEPSSPAEPSSPKSPASRRSPTSHRSRPTDEQREQNKPESASSPPRRRFASSTASGLLLGGLSRRATETEPKRGRRKSSTHQLAEDELVGGRVGMLNLGNTCFMNAALQGIGLSLIPNDRACLQCLSHTDVLTHYFLRTNVWREDLNQNNVLGSGGKVACAYAELLGKLWAGNKASISPAEFKRTIGEFAPQFAGYRQHDAQEFASFLLDGLHEDLNRQRGKKEYIEDVELDYVNGPSTSGSSVGHEGNEDDSGASAFAAGVGVGGSGPRIRPSPMVAAAEEEAVAAEAWGNHLRRDRSVIVDTFQGQLRSVLKCSHCGATRTKFDPFMYLSVPMPRVPSRKSTNRRQSSGADGAATGSVPQNSAGLTLRDCIEEYMREETLDGDNLWRCFYCKDFRPATKTLTLWKLPSHLCVHLKRFGGGGGGGGSDRYRKRTETVAINHPDHLDLSTLVGSTSSTTSATAERDVDGLGESEDGGVDRESLEAHAAAAAPAPFAKTVVVESQPQAGSSRSPQSGSKEEEVEEEVADVSSKKEPSSLEYIRNDSTSEEIVTGDGARHVYQLYAVCNHVGSLSGGHYTALARCARDGRWYSYNDSRCSPLAEGEDVVSPDNYVLFFRKVDMVPRRRKRRSTTLNKRDAANADVLAQGASHQQAKIGPGSEEVANGPRGNSRRASAGPIVALGTIGGLGGLSGLGVLSGARSKGSNASAPPPILADAPSALFSSPATPTLPRRQTFSDIHSWPFAPSIIPSKFQPGGSLPTRKDNPGLVPLHGNKNSSRRPSSREVPSQRSPSANSHPSSRRGSFSRTDVRDTKSPQVRTPTTQSPPSARQSRRGAHRSPLIHRPQPGMQCSPQIKRRSPDKMSPSSHDGNPSSRDGSCSPQGRRRDHAGECGSSVGCQRDTTVQGRSLSPDGLEGSDPAQSVDECLEPPRMQQERAKVVVPYRDADDTPAPCEEGSFENRALLSTEVRASVVSPILRKLSEHMTSRVQSTINGGSPHGDEDNGGEERSKGSRAIRRRRAGSAIRTATRTDQEGKMGAATDSGYALNASGEKEREDKPENALAKSNSGGRTRRSSKENGKPSNGRSRVSSRRTARHRASLLGQTHTANHAPNDEDMISLEPFQDDEAAPSDAPGTTLESSGWKSPFSSRGSPGVACRNSAGERSVFSRPAYPLRDVRSAPWSFAPNRGRSRGLAKVAASTTPVRPDDLPPIRPFVSKGEPLPPLPVTAKAVGAARGSNFLSSRGMSSRLGTSRFVSLRPSSFSRSSAL